MSESMSAMFVIAETPAITITQTYKAVKFGGLWWSRHGVFGSETAAHGAFEALAEEAAKEYRLGTDPACESASPAGEA